MTEDFLLDAVDKLVEAGEKGCCYIVIAQNEGSDQVHRCWNLADLKTLNYFKEYIETLIGEIEERFEGEESDDNAP